MDILIDKIPSNFDNTLIEDFKTLWIHTLQQLNTFFEYAMTPEYKTGLIEREIETIKKVW